MTRRPLAALLLALTTLAGCGWSNSMYLARRYTRDAIRSEREGRPFDAQSYWGQALTKADSAWSRSGKTRYEALAYRGVAKARIGDCVGAIPDLETVVRRSPATGWGQDAYLDLGRCRERIGAAGAEESLLPLLASEDPVVRRASANLLAGLYLRTAQWEPLRTLAPDLDDPAIRFGRGAAMLALRDPAGRALVAPFVEARDTSMTWAPLIEALARQRHPWTDSLIEALRATLPPADARPTPWLLAAYRGALAADDTLAAGRRFEALRQFPTTEAWDEAMRLNAGYRFAAARSLDDIARVLDGLPPTGPEDGGHGSAVLALRRVAVTMLGERDSLTGVPEGDLRLLLQAEDATLVLHAPGVARTMYARLEREWPASPYLVKALLARMVIDPDSVEALRQRLALHPENPYLAALQGRDDNRYLALEDSLGNFQRIRVGKVAMAPVHGTERE